jgi:biotin synthase
MVMDLSAEIKCLEGHILKGGSLTGKEAVTISSIPDSDIFGLFASANKIRSHFRGNTVGLCSIVNAKSGACTEDCRFCAQSAKSRAEIEVYPLLEKEAVLEKAFQAKNSGAGRFSIVTSGRTVTHKDLLEIAGMISGIREAGLLPCASLGLLKEEELLLLKKAGLDRYHHNLETSERFFPQICSTHTYVEKIRTIQAAKSAGLSVCSGGLFGIGEMWKDRIDMAFALRELDVDSVPINFLIPIAGSALDGGSLLHPFEALKIASLYRFIHPQKEIRICGGRLQVLGEFNTLVFAAAADGMNTSNYRNTSGRSPEDDLKLIELFGLEVL